MKFTEERKQNPRKLKELIQEGVLTVHQPLLARVISKYKEEKDNKNLTSVVVFGDYSLPLAIELSQWRYDTTYVAKDKQESNYAVREGFKYGLDLFSVSKSKILPKSTLVVFLDALEGVRKKKDVQSYLQKLLKKCDEVIFSVKTTRKWESYLKSFDYTIELYPNKKRVLISLKVVKLVEASSSQDPQLGALQRQVFGGAG